MKGELNMEKFEIPAVEVITFAVEDVITASSGFIAPTPGKDQTPYG